MGLLRQLKDLYKRFHLWRLRRAGLTFGEGCRFSGLPSFGTEPYLITLGNHVAIASDVVFITHDGGTFAFRHLERYQKVIKYGRITIKDHCVIGERAIILPGVTIGPNSVVAAGSVVSRNIPPSVLAAGNPAKPFLTLHQYAEWALAANPAYDPEEYRRNKRGALLKMTMRGSARRTAPPGQPAGDSAGAAPPDPTPR
ncbi:acyltransferase [Geothrix sp. 21YS21S-2]|uniref:acyltransferase n=1 Tax=Geothrix sp. 21YS21S-2 TaxID=3068893 RepID=UPI0027BA5FA8|nr:acyltransferase [Geothrix sp. 21YS21S-2]